MNFGSLIDTVAFLGFEKIGSNHVVDDIRGSIVGDLRIAGTDENIILLHLLLFLFAHEWLSIEFLFHKLYG